VFTTIETQHIKETTLSYVYCAETQHIKETTLNYVYTRPKRISYRKLFCDCRNLFKSASSCLGFIKVNIKYSNAICKQNIYPVPIKIIDCSYVKNEQTIIKIVSVRIFKSWFHNDNYLHTTCMYTSTVLYKKNYFINNIWICIKNCIKNDYFDVNINFFLSEI